MKRYFTLLIVIAAISTALLSSCRFECKRGSGNPATENRKVTDFKKIKIDGGYKLNLKQDSSLTVTVTADDNLLKYIKTEVSGNELHINTGHKNLCPNGDIVINVGVHNLEAIETSGAVEINGIGKLVTHDIDLKFSGSTKINLELDAANIHTEGSGASEINLKGQASSHTVNFSGDGSLHAFDLVTGNYTISTSGSSDCEINVLHDLNVQSSGASSIKYKGNPAHVNNDKSGSSTITKIN
jgi:hypothetical protein